MVWQPLNLSQVCSTIPSDAELTGCSNFAYVYLNLLVSLFGDSYDHRMQQKLKYYHEQCNDSVNESVVGEQYDFIVVGAGSAGCVVANRLTEIEQWKVLLLEAGPEQPDVTLIPGVSTSLLGSNLDWSYSMEPNGKSCLARPGQRCNSPRGKGMGGSSSINSLAYIRGNKLDYDTWAQLGNEGWSYDEVLPYFIKSEKNLNEENLNRKYHGVDGLQSISRYPYIDDPSIMLVDAFAESGLPVVDYNAESQLGTIQDQAFSQGGARVSTNNAYIQTIRYKRKNLTVKVNSEVTKILIDGNNVAYGVEYINTENKKMYKATATKEVIVSGGTINSPKLLMLSGIGPTEHLKALKIPVKKNLDVGENLHDHVTFNGIFIALSNKTSTLVSREEILNDVQQYHDALIKNGPLAGNGPTNAIAFIKTDPNLPAPDIQFQVGNCLLNEYINDIINYESVPILPTPYYDGLLPRTMNLVPKSRGKLLLNATNPNGPPLLHFNYYGDESDLIPLVKGVRYLLQLENTNAFKSRGAYFVRTPLGACKDIPWGTDEYIVCLARSYTGSTYHPVGTCKMGPECDEKAVVDPKLRVYGIKGLRVIDASIMPIVIRGNTNAPSIMIGERGVEFVIDEWLKKSKCAIRL